MIASTGWKKIEAIIKKQISDVISSLIVYREKESFDMQRIIAKQVEIKTLSWVLGKVDEMLSKEVEI